MLQRLGVLFSGLWLVSIAFAGAAHADADAGVWCGNDTAGRSASVTAVCDVRSLTRASIQDSQIAVTAKSGSRISYDYVSFKPDSNTSAVLFVLQTGGKSHPNDSAREIARLVKYAGQRKFGFYTFSDSLDKVVPIGVSSADLDAALKTRRVRQPRTTLYTALNSALDDLAGVDAMRRTVVLLGDGSSGREVLLDDDIVAKSLRLDIPVFTIAFTDNRVDGTIKEGLKALRSLAARTNGVFEDAGPKRVVSDDYVRNFYHYVENGGELEISSSKVSTGDLLDFDLPLSNGGLSRVSDVPVRVVAAATPPSRAGPTPVAGGTQTGDTAASAVADPDPIETAQADPVTSDESSSNDDAASDDEDTAANEDDDATDNEEEKTGLDAFLDDPVAWSQDNPFPAISALVAVLGLGALGLIVMLRPGRPADDFGQSGFDMPNEPHIVPEPAVVQVGGGNIAETVLLGGEPPRENVIVPTDTEKTVPETSPTAGDMPKIYAYLEFLDSDETRAPIIATNVRIGRHRDNDICIANHSVHRQHAVIFQDSDGTFVIRDLGTKNGIVVNNVRCSQTVLNDGDIIELGEVRLRYASSS